MNWRQLVARLKQETTRTGAAPASPDTSTRDDASLWNWVSDAWVTLQTNGTLWRFMRLACTVTTSANVADYNYAALGLAAQFRRLWPSNDSYRPRVSNAEGASWLMQREMAYDDFVAAFPPGHQPGPPTFYTMTPDRKLRIGPTPDGIYTIAIDVMRPTQVFSVVEDAPEGLPDEHQLVLVWDALKRAAIDDAAPEILSRANDEYSQAYARLFIDEGPKVELLRRSL